MYKCTNAAYHNDQVYIYTHAMLCATPAVKNGNMYSKVIELQYYTTVSISASTMVIFIFHTFEENLGMKML